MKHYLRPEKKLTDEVIEYLKSRARGEGKNYFDHLMIVVPTAESGRTLRLALAKAFSPDAILAPRVVQPSALLTPADKNIRLASDIEIQCAFLAFVQDPANNVAQWSTLFQKSFLEQNDSRAMLGFLEQLTEIWRALAGNGFLMRDVLKNERAAECLSRAEGLEEERWRELAMFENAFFDFLSRRELCPYALYIQKALACPAPLPDGIDEVILPALADPVRAMFPVLQKVATSVTILIHADTRDSEKFDEWGIPKANAWDREVLATLESEDIFCATTYQMLGEQVANAFANKERTKQPALGLADPSVFVDVQSALMDRDLLAYLPERHSLKMSSLGDMISLWCCAWEERRARDMMTWKTFSGLLRSRDVMNTLLSRDATLNRERALEELSRFANMFFPTREPNNRELAIVEKHISFKMLAKARDELNKLFDATLPLATALRNVLATIYSQTEDNKEFIAAATAVRNVLDECDKEIFSSLSDRDQVLVARDGFSHAQYQLDPDDKNVIKTLGWLELAWTTKSQLALAGFHEGMIPDALVGHAFLPDALRVALGLTSNAQRLARDIFLLKEILLSRQAHDVKFFIARTNGTGEIQKPSRLLFLCDNRELPSRVKHLFDEIPIATTYDEKQSEEAYWKYELPTNVKLPHARDRFRGTVSPSMLDLYLNNPFACFLTYFMKMETVKVAEELAANEYGSIAHAIMDAFAKNHLKNPIASDVATIREELAKLCEEEFSRRYGDRRDWATTVALQLDAIKSRVCAFAKIQSRWASDGWQIVASEEKLNRDGEVFPFQKHPDVALRGTIDRIDFHPSYGYRLIDFKTWDKKARKYVFSASDDVCEKMIARGLPLLTREETLKSGETRREDLALLTIQLPLYARALEAKNPSRFANKIYDMCYVILGKDENSVETYMGADEKKYRLIDIREIADTVVDVLVDQLVANKFWHPTDNILTYDFKEFFDPLLAKNIAQEWIEKMTIQP